MGNILCPECNKRKYKKYMSSYAKQCPDCGFPMASFLEENKLTEFNKAWICTKCAYIYDNESMRMPICEYCNSTVVQTNIDNKECFKKLCNLSNEEFENYAINLAKKYGDNFSEEDCKHRRKVIKERMDNWQPKSTQHQPSPQVTCPYCKSTNTKKISAVSRAGSILGFGLFSKKLGKEWHCNDCGSDF